MSDAISHLDGVILSLDEKSSISFFAVKGVLTEARDALVKAADRSEALEKALAGVMADVRMIDRGKSWYAAEDVLNERTDADISN